MKILIAGAGGHALELIDEFHKLDFAASEITFFDETNNSKCMIRDSYRIFSSEKELIDEYEDGFSFCLGVGNPALRRIFYNKLRLIHGEYFPLHSRSTVISPTAVGRFDALAHSFVGAHSHIGLGSLINVSAHVHHECEVGEFCELSPGALMLGKSKIGNNCRLGAGSILLPGVTLGDDVTVGAGAVVTKDFNKAATILGVPARHHIK